MKIAYVTLHLDPKIINGGAGGKIKNQIAIWNSMGHSTELFILTPAIIPNLQAHQFLFNRSSPIPLLNLFIREISRSFALKCLINEVFLFKPDMVYLRFGLFSLPLHILFRGPPVVLEVNTNDLVEYRSRGIFLYLLNLFTRDILFSRCSGWIATSYELATHYANKRHVKPVCVISNGSKLEETVPLIPPSNSVPHLTLAGSPGMSWHGVDKLLSFAKAHPDIIVNIIGYDRYDFDGAVPQNMILHGYLRQDKVREILAGTDVVFGSLALHRKGMDEASPLKVREAIAYGIPVIIAYHDTDLSSLGLDTILQLPNSEDNIEKFSESIYAFSWRMMGKRIDRETVGEILDQRNKEVRRLNFFREIISVETN